MEIYDLVILKEHPFSADKRIADFSFIYDELHNYCLETD